jgi:hypothetical protein
MARYGLAVAPPEAIHPMIHGTRLVAFCDQRDSEGQGGVVGEALLPGSVEIGATADLGAVSRGDECVVETVAPAGAPDQLCSMTCGCRAR